MGWSLSWVAVRGIPAEEVRRRLGLRPTGSTSEVPEARFSETSAGKWTVVCADHSDRFVDGAVLAPLSRAGEAVGVFVEEHVMFAQAVCWQDGRHRWSVTHEAERSLDHLQTAGELPDVFADVEAKALAARLEDPQGADFLFDVPLDLAAAAVGFRHDDAEERVFAELAAREDPTAAVAPEVAPRPGLVGAVSRWLRAR